MPTGDEIGLEKSQQHIAAPIQHRTDLEEVEKKRLEANLNFGGVPEPSGKVAEGKDDGLGFRRLASDDFFRDYRFVPTVVT